MEMMNRPEVLDGESAQRRFVVYGQSRSGSTLVTRLLAQHPQVECEGELLNGDDGYLPNTVVRTLVRQYPMSYFALRAKRSRTAAYGFKLFFYHPRRPSRTIKQLAERNWAFVHLRRRNVASQSLSSLVAGKTGRYARETSADTPDLRVSVSLAELQQEIDKRAAWTTRELDLIDGIDRIELWYEDDLQDETSWQSSVNRVADYLSICRQPISSPNFEPTHEREYHDIVSNYEELRALINP
jgi:LPS sulfotransferase NodH